MRRYPLGFAFATMLMHLAMSSPAWSEPPGQGLPRWHHGSRVVCIGFIADGKQLLTASQHGSFHVWDLATAQELRRFGRDLEIEAVPKTPATMVLSRTGRILAAAGQDGTIQLWDSATGKESHTLGTPVGNRAAGQPVSLAFAPDSTMLAARFPDRVVRLFAVDTGKELCQLGKAPDPRLPRRMRFAYGPHCDNSLAFAPDGKTLIVADVELDPQRGVVRAWTVASAQLREQLFVEQNNPFFDARTGFGVVAAAFPNDRRVLLAWASSDGTARLYEPTAEKEPRRLAAVQQGVYVAFVFAPDGSTLAARASNSTAIRLYDTETGKQVMIPGEPDTGSFSSQQLAFSPDGKILASARGTTVRLWEVASGKEIQPVNGR